MSPQTITPTTFAQRIGVNTSTVLRLIRGGRLRALDVSAGRARPTYRILVASARDYLKKTGLAEAEIQEIVAV